MHLYNTLTREIEEFSPLKPPEVTFYACGFTSYDYSHIGHARKYTNDDLLKRVLIRSGYKVHHIMNITDVGHLDSDGDEGEDKLSKGASKYGKTVEDVAKFFTDDFMSMLTQMNITLPEKVPHATDHIQEMIDLIKILLEKGNAYITKEAIYFDVTTFEGYGKLSGQSLEDKQTAVREEVKEGKEKKNPADFSLWFFRVGRFESHAMHWDSPWGDGFPGWHIECSAMSMKYLGQTLDIHSGGIDLIPVHHENEIAQSEAVTGKPFVRYWFHSYFLMVDGIKMSKSLGNFTRVVDVIEKGFSPLALRYLFLQTHYRSEINFTWESLQAAENALKKLKTIVSELKSETGRQQLSEEKLDKIEEYRSRFDEAVATDLQIPQALAILWEVVKSNIPSPDKLDFILDADTIFGLKLDEKEAEEIVPEEIIQLAKDREVARKEGDFAKADEIRSLISQKGYILKDTTEGYAIKKN
ncbi:MAG: cysteine--tRNA ligase [Candidatus Roizmanbacteria bacterium]